MEHLRRPSEEQESLIRLLPEHLRVLRSEAAERGAGNVVVLSDQHVPPSPPDETGEQVPQVSNDDDDELEKDLMQEFGMGVGVVRSRPESHDDELQELQHVAQRPRLDNTLNPHVGMSTEEEDNDRNSLGTQESEGSHVKTPYSEGTLTHLGTCMRNMVLTQVWNKSRNMSRALNRLILNMVQSGRLVSQGR